ncbi:flagellin FliC, partial [Serratia marcescens]|nr:flagellin FliC [Serratia marcescens]
VADGIDTTKVGAKATNVQTGKDLTITNTTNKQANGAAPASFLKDNATGDIYAVGTDGKNYKATIDKTSGDITAIAAAETTGLTDTSATTTVKEEVAASGPDAANLHSYDNGKSYVI